MVRVFRWICEKCDKKWIHPVGKCIYCGEDVKKQVGTKTKVIGCTKVFTSNPLHPIVPYNVLILEDEHGNRMPKKTISDYSVGDDYSDTPDSSENVFVSIKIKYDFDEAVSEALELIGGLDIKGKKILIKPNLSVPGYPYLGMSTNPKVVDSLIKYLLDNGAKNTDITIVEQSFFVPFEKAVSKSGFPQLIKKYNVNYKNIAETEFEQKQEGEFKFEISKILTDADLIINVPVIKTDMVLGMDGAFENLTRFLSKKTFDELAKDPKKAVIALSVLPKVIPKFITLGDASIGLQGNGPAVHGQPGFFNMIFASRNPVVHDLAVQEIFCLNNIPYVELAGKQGLGESDISKIKFLGNELNAIIRDIKQPIGSKLIKQK